MTNLFKILGYIDPGSGIAILTFILGLIGAGFHFIKRILLRLKNYFINVFK